jgi:hypothetical protein
MNADFLAVLEFWEREKGISRDVLVQAVEEALLSAAKKAVGPARELRCAIDTKTGDIKAFAKLVVSEKVLSKHDQISVFDARRIKADAQLGEELEVEVTPAGFGRIASQFHRVQRPRGGHHERGGAAFRTLGRDGGPGQIRGPAASPRARADRRIPDRRANPLLR